MIVTWDKKNFSTAIIILDKDEKYKLGIALLHSKTLLQKKIKKSFKIKTNCYGLTEKTNETIDFVDALLDALYIYN